MTLVETPLDTLDYVNGSAIPSPAAETAILSTDVAFSGISTRQIRIRVNLNITEGTTGTAFVVRLRRGSGTGGALVQAALTVTLAAAANAQFSHTFQDAPDNLNASAGGQYTVTIAETGATVNGTVNAIDIEVLQ